MPTQLSVVRQLNGTRGPGTGTCCLCRNHILAGCSRNNQKSHFDFSASGWIRPPSLVIENSPRAYAKRKTGSEWVKTQSQRRIDVIMEKFLFLLLLLVFSLLEIFPNPSGKIRERSSTGVFDPRILWQNCQTVSTILPAFHGSSSCSTSR